MQPTEVLLTLPKLRFTSESVSLVPALKAHGMNLAFTGAAFFSSLSTSTRVVIFDVLHTAMVGLDEHGVEATAATAVIGGGCGKLRGGQHINFKERTPLANVLLTMLQRADVPIESVGDSTGVIAEL